MTLANSRLWPLRVQLYSADSLLCVKNQHVEKTGMNN